MEISKFLKYLNEFELKYISNASGILLSNDLRESIKGCHKLSEALCYIIECFINGDYKSVLQMQLGNYGFTVPTKYRNLDDIVQDLVNDDYDSDRNIKEFILVFIAIAALQEFIRCNFCGPQDKTCDYNVISDILPIPDSEITLLLSLDGEHINSNVLSPKLLFLSSFLLSHINCDASSTQKWWLLRCKFVHQSILPERNESLHNSLASLVSDIGKNEWISLEENINLKLMFFVECCHIFLFYGEILEARKYVTEAQIMTGLEIELSGALGKRTQYQQKPVAQLFVKLKRNHIKFAGSVPTDNKFIPLDLHLQDDVLLNKVAFLDDDAQVIENLYYEEQMVLLAFCCLVGRSGSFDELLQEELMSYINCLLSQPQIWSICLKALTMRCKIEKNSSRRIERAVMQMESIVNAVRKDSPPFKEREKFFYCTSFPAYWTLEKTLADLLLSIGCIKSALEVYERLQLWEEIVDCYIRLGRTSSAEKIIRDQLEKSESPLLWCLLGDVTENIEYYDKAWELSNHRSARAQRSIGYFYFKRKEYEKSVLCFVSSLEINHLQPQVWFSTGHAATQTENFELAARAYRQVVMFDEDNFEAWNNLANAYIKTKQKERAWRSLQEALKCNYEEWRVWENFLLVSTDVGAFEDALRAWHRLLDIKGKHHDSLLLDILVNAIVKDLPDIYGSPSSRLKKRTLELLGRITSITTNDPKVWESYALLTSSKTVEESDQRDNLEKAVIYQQKAVRCYNQKESWERDFNVSKEVLSCAVKLAELYLSLIKLLDDTQKNQPKTSARLNLQSVVLRSKKFIDFFPEVEKKELNDIISSVQELLNEILAF